MEASKFIPRKHNSNEIDWVTILKYAGALIMLGMIYGRMATKEDVISIDNENKVAIKVLDEKNATMHERDRDRVDKKMDDMMNILFDIQKQVSRKK